MNKPILSIGILVSGPYYQVKKTIESLAPIRRAIPCQLIITDTRMSQGDGVLGSSFDALTAYLKKEADVYDTFTWVNDFAAARNANLKHATGKWYLYLDDDEVLTEGIEDFVAFFRGDEIDAYDSGEYIQRNHTDRTGVHYNDYYVQRMKRLTPETRFVSRIHEYMVPYPDRVVVFGLVADHYGYVYDTEEEKTAHARRNRDLLLALKADEPENLRCRQQLLLEMAHDADLPGFAEMALENLSHIPRHDEKHEIPMIWDLYGGAVYGLTRLLSLPDEEDEEAWHLDGIGENAAGGKSADSLDADQNGTAGLLEEIGVADGRMISFPKLYEAIERICREGLAYKDAGNMMKAMMERGLAIMYAHAGRYGDAAAARARFEACRLAALADTNALQREKTASFIMLASKNPFADRQWFSGDFGEKGAGLKPPVLSIGMLVSDSKGTAKTALDALRYLRSVLPCELVVTDTRKMSQGGRGAWSILENETEMDQTPRPRGSFVYHTFAWCDDFAAARNANLAQASGEWYMFLDDDELLTDVSNLVGFFESGAYRDADAGEIVIRSYDDYERSGYSDAWLTRLRKRTPDLHFEDCIHEHFEPRPERSVRISVIADHFGYVYPDEAARQAHMKRNRDLLLKMLEKDPKNLRAREQMLLEYDTAGDFEGLLAFSKESLEISKGMTGRYEIPCVWAFMGAGARALSELERFEELETWCETCLSDGRLDAMCRGLLLGTLAEIRFGGKRYESALALIKEYEKVHDSEDPASDYYHMEEGVPFIGAAFSRGWTDRIGKMRAECEQLLYMKKELLGRIEALEKAGQQDVASTLRAQLAQLFCD